RIARSPAVSVPLVDEAGRDEPLAVAERGYVDAAVAEARRHAYIGIAMALAVVDRFEDRLAGVIAEQPAIIAGDPERVDQALVILPHRQRTGHRRHLDGD